MKHAQTTKSQKTRSWLSSNGSIAAVVAAGTQGTAADSRDVVAELPSVRTQDTAAAAGVG